MSQEAADTKIDAARVKVQEWGARINQGTWDWHPLGQALQLCHEAVESQHDYQRSWTLLADIYHRIGKTDLASRCLRRSYDLAKPGPNHPGRFYREVQEHLSTGYPFDSRGGLRRQEAPDWFAQKYQRYWVIDNKLLANSRLTPASLATVFISYTREDQATAERLRAELEKRGFAVWKDTKDILPGERWEEVIRDNIRRNDFVAVCLSRVAVAKIGFFQVELKAALYWQQYRPANQVYLIPVRFEDCPVPNELSPFQYADVFDDLWEQGVAKIERAMLTYRPH